jgi:glucosamine--fructose-6-phosphate aminotransferase (isomerizing)
LFTLYRQPPRLKGALVAAISQSGQSPDVVSVLEEGRRQGCPTLAITNNPASPLARAADFVIDLQAGAETAVAATKTYTAELMALAMLSAALAESRPAWETLLRVPDWAQAALDKVFASGAVAERYRYLSRCVVLGRSFNYATAYEWALKLKELTYLIAEPYSSADFLHGPIAMVEPGFAVLAVAPSGEVYADLLSLVERLRREQQAELVVVSDRPEALALAQTPLSLPAGIPEWVSPLVTILPGQVFAMALTGVKGLNSEQPRTIHKVTETL